MTCFRAIFRKSFSDKITPGRDDLTPRDATSVKKDDHKKHFFSWCGVNIQCVIPVGKPTCNSMHNFFLFLCRSDARD